MSRRLNRVAPVRGQSTRMPARYAPAPVKASVRELADTPLIVGKKPVVIFGILAPLRPASCSHARCEKVPEYSDRRAEVHEFYESANYALAWVSDARATPQALTLIGLFRDAASQGLRPEDYDGPRWSGRLRRLNQ